MQKHFALLFVFVAACDPTATIHEIDKSSSALGDDAGDGSVCGAPSSDPTVLLDFLNAVASRYCNALGNCCGEIDAGTWDESACEALVGPAANYPHSGVAEINSIVPYLDSGTIALDSVHAENCLHSCDTFSCDMLTSTENGSRMYECAQSIIGLVPLGGTCTSSMQCAGDAWCNRYYTEGYDTCMPIGGIGSPCGIDSSDYACQTHGHGLQAQACDWDVHAATGTQTCQALRPIGASDGYPSQCATGLAAGGVCVSELPSVPSYVCTLFHK